MAARLPLLKAWFKRQTAKGRCWDWEPCSFRRRLGFWSIALLGIFATAQVIGGVVGPIVSGLVLQHFGFNMTLIVFAVLARLAAAIFQLLVPNSQPTQDPEAALAVNA